MASTTSSSALATEQLMDIVGSGWQASACPGDALGGLLCRARPVADLVALGDVWEATRASLARPFGQLTPTADGQLVAGRSRLAANRADEWRWLRDQHPKQGRASVRPTGDLSQVVAQ